MGSNRNRVGADSPKAVRTGRPSTFSPDVAERICGLIATTPRGLAFLCRADGKLPHVSTVLRWLSQDAGFRDGYLRARELQADLIFDECLEIADDSTGDG
ncbi:MAG: hypothetical protein ACREQ5_20590, partial [Candidatus Dormibacteria bacterium]